MKTRGFGRARRTTSLNAISTYLRSPLLEKPFKKAQGKTVLEPEAMPPSIFAIEMLAFLPGLQRERSGFVERLATYFSTPSPKRAFFQLAGKKILPPLFVILGDPLRADAHGHAFRMCPFAVYWLELPGPFGAGAPAPLGLQSAGPALFRV